MKPTEFQSGIKALLEAAFPAFAPVITEDNFTDFETQIEAHETAKGVCFVLSDPDLTSMKPAHGSTLWTGEASLELNVFESPSASPKNAALVEAILAAFRTHNGTTTQPFDISIVGASRAEGGAQLTVYSISAHLTF